NQISADQGSFEIIKCCRRHQIVRLFDSFSKRNIPYSSYQGKAIWVCMMKLYNQPVSATISMKNLRKLTLLALGSGLIFAGSGCGNEAETATNKPAVKPSSQAIAEAEQFYAGRKDLVNVRKAIVSLRQAQADDPTNYDLAWRLAKFNYYLGAHSPDSNE